MLDNEMIHTFRLFASTALAFALTLSAAAQTANPAANSLQVKTDKGVVEGAYTTDQKVIAFKGIPYAKPPVGNLRWQPPMPSEKWEGVRPTKDFGSHCYQGVTYSDMVFRDPGPSEDCLTLNVWTPSGAAPGSLPVMVWIYGGGFIAGGTSEARQDGQFLAHRNVVIVSMNYRLGVFGFFAHPELTAESPRHASGNYGFMDQTAALEWVKANIASFGGNPNNITLFGESAGSFSVSTLMASPVSKNLFQKAIGESGGAFSRPGHEYMSRGTVEYNCQEFARLAFHTAALSDLRKFSGDQISAAAMERHFSPGPDVDGYFLPISVPQIYAAGRQAHIPLLAGWNADEARAQAVNADPKITVAVLQQEAQKDFGAATAEFLKYYPASNDTEALQSASDYYSDRFISYTTWRWLEAHVQTGGGIPVYRYRFDLGSPGDKNHSADIKAFHSDDIEYVFGTLDSRPEAKWRPEDRKLSDQIGSYWTNFALTGDPNGGATSSSSDLPKWPTYNAAGGWQVMHLDATSEAKPDTLRDRYLFLYRQWGRANQ
jgi:para-nitrobenzyl esterase